MIVQKFLKSAVKICSFFLIICCLFLFNFSLKAQENSVCIECHSDPDMKMEKNGKEISIFVKESILSHSVHGQRKCVDCHVGFNPEEVPHKAKITPVNCRSCHQNVEQIHKFHPQMARATGMGGSMNVNCKGCHGKHNVMSPKNPDSKFNIIRLTDACGNCHKTQKALHVQSEHYLARTSDEKVPTCIYCHMNPITKGHLLDPLQMKINQEKLCLSCHLNNPSVKSPFAKSLINYEQSVHGSALLKGRKEAAACIDCHGYHNLQKKEAPTSRINQFNVPSLCGKCHFYVAREYNTSVHGISLKKGNIEAPGCTYCHGEHGIKPPPEVSPRVLGETHIKQTTIVKNKMVFCLACHADEQKMAKFHISSVAKAHEWIPNKATHWETVRCIDCHTSYEPPNLSHNILPPDKTIKKCEECHNQNSILMTKLYKHQKQQSREKYGFINGTLLSDAYVVGTTRNFFLEFLSVLGIGFAVVGIGTHALLRWRANRKNKNLFKRVNKKT